MSSIPVLRPREAIAILEAPGFREVRQRGSHKRFLHADGRAATVPVHDTRDISPLLLRRIALDAGMTVQDFVDSGNS